MYLCDIEIPVANKQGVIYSCLIPSFKHFFNFSKQFRFLLNFNGQTTQKDIDNVLFELNKYSLNYNYVINDYSNCSNNILKFRNDTHCQVKDNAPYFLFLDDDCQVLNEEYVKQVLNVISFLEENPSVGMVGLYGGDWAKKYEQPKPSSLNISVFTGNGLVCKNISTWGGIVPHKYTFFWGTGEDDLLMFARREIGLDFYIMYSNNCKHMELQTHYNGQIERGYKYWDWGEYMTQSKGSFDYLFRPYKKIEDGKNYWVWDPKKAFPQFLKKDGNNNEK